MERHERIHLYLDHDDAGKKFIDMALKRSSNYKNESSLYEGYKDLNDWVVNFGKLQKKQSLKLSNKIRFRKLSLLASYVSTKSKRWFFHPVSTGFKKKNFCKD